MATKAELKKLKVQELRDECTARGLITTGTKAILIARLEHSIESEEIAVETVATGELESKEAEGKLPETDEAPNSVLDDPVSAAEKDKEQIETMGEDTGNPPATEPSGVEAQPSTSDAVKELFEDDEGKREPIIFSEQLCKLEKRNSEKLAVKTEDERRKDRAKRFGLSHPELEEEKRKTRARRFGLPVLEDELEKKRARAKRFGLPIPEEEELKKKQRAMRFGLSPLAGLSEEEKLKQRAKRFGMTK